MQRFTPGPLNGFFDELAYDSPAFVPVVLTCTLLVFVWAATAWALWRLHPQPLRPAPGGFPVKFPGAGKADA